MIARETTWRLGAASALCYALAFNIIFFVQELFLVLPKALTPGLHPILYHNNHNWTGHHPLENLFQGTGALATVIVGACALLWLRRARSLSPNARLFAAWLAYHGFFLASPQVVIGNFVPANDVGRAMDWFALGAGAKLAFAVAALLVMPLIAWALLPEFVESGTPLPARAALRTATLPALIGTVLVLPFRVPGNPVEVALVPAIVFCAGVIWMQLLAFGPVWGRARWSGGIGLLIPAVALLALLLVFHLVLRPGIAF